MVDRSGNNNHARQAQPADNKPTFGTNEIQFDGTNDTLVFSSLGLVLRCYGCICFHACK